jgi:2-polyprenyl-3-methyl-5-hydroxy-6-metoxy-1,4-benzoquinol methylase
VILSVAKQNGWQTIGGASDKAKIAKRSLICGRYSRITNQSFDVISMWHVLEHVPNSDNQVIIKYVKYIFKTFF